MTRFVSAACVAGVVLLSVLAGQAWAGEPAPGWEIFSRAVPSNFSAKPTEGFPDGYELVVRNAGSQSTDGSPVTISDTLPEGVTAIEVVGYDLGPGLKEEFINEQQPVALKCELRLHSVTCADGSVVMPGDTLTVSITVKVSSEIPEGQAVVNTAAVSGGGASAQTSSISTPVQAGALPFGLESVVFAPAGVGGAEDTEAGGHPYELTTTFYLNTREEYQGAFAKAKTPEDAKDVVVELPPGFVGNPQVVQKCSQILASTKPEPGGSVCPPSSQIGVARLGLRNLSHEPLLSENVVPVYNVQPGRGAAAQFEFFDVVPVTLVATANQETNYAIRVTVSDIPREAEFNASSLTFFGEPASNHDIYNRGAGVGQPLAFLQNPVDCSVGPLHARVSLDSWQSPGSYLPDGSPNLADPNWKTYTTTMYPSLSGCNLLQFEPSITLTPSTTRADEPTGVNVDLRVPQAADRLGELATPELKDATVTLPAGLSLSPSAADGLGACSNAQIDIASIEAGSCPEASVLGTIKVSVPLLESPLEGQVFLGEPECNPCTAADAADGRMIRLFIEGTGSGVRLKKEGRVYLNPSTGQLTSKFENNPQDPFENLELDFKSGLRAGLATPQTCGTATTTSDLKPWSSPVTPDANPSSQFNVSWDGNGGACPAVPPLSPSFSAGTSNPNAGEFSPFTLTFGREDREQDLAGIQVHMPPGLLGSLSEIPLCGEPEASLGTCGQASLIGTMTVAAGPGAHPFYEKGEIYLTGPYGGAPFGLSIVVPTVAGPFNLGNVVVRARIQVDPTTAALTVTSDPFPQVIDGIPLRLRTANVTIGRPGFIFNPTNCALQHITATISGAQGSQTNVSVPFGVSGCAGLHFGPTFKAYTSAKTSRAGGASLDVRLSFPSGPQSNIAHVRVELPKALPSRLSTLQRACTIAVFEANPAGCPAGSVVGIARADSPILPVALEGPAYFVSHGGAKFPELIVVLEGYGVRVDLYGETFINKQGITSSTFANVPDVQVNSFELYLPEGPDSALAANGNLCTKKLAMPTLFTAQDGAQLKQNTPIQVTGCGTSARAARAARAERAARKANKAGAARMAREVAAARKASRARSGR
jgi:hypothetical protein